MTQRSDLDITLGSSFSVARAKLMGTSRNRLDASDLVAPFHGARSRGGDDLSDVLALCSAYLPVAPRSFAFSHITAARLYGMPLPRSISGAWPLHVSVPEGSTPPRRAGVIGHRGLRDIHDLGGLPVVPPEVAWLQLADLVSKNDLVTAADYLVRRKRPLSTLERLRETLEGAQSKRGVQASRRALREVRPGTDSPRETRLRLLIVQAGLPEPEIGHTLFYDGAFVGTPDLAYPRERIAIEYEGEHHRSSVAVYEDDISRRELFRRAGWVAFLVTATRLSRPPALIGELGALLLERQQVAESSQTRG